MSDFELPDLSGKKDDVTTQNRPWWQALVPVVAALALVAFALFGFIGLNTGGNESASAATSTSAPPAASMDVVPMVSKEDLATCPEQKSWDDWYRCMQKVPGGTVLLTHFDDDTESRLKIADVKRMMEKTPGKDARVIFVYPSASGWSDEKIREAAAADVNVDVASMKELKIVKVTRDIPAEWQTIVNTRELEENIYAPFVDTRTDEDQVRVSLAPLNEKGEVDIKEPWAGVFTSCGNKHWQKRIVPGTPSVNIPVVSTNRTTVISSTPKTTTSTRTSTITTSTTRTCTVTCVITTTTQPPCVPPNPDCTPVTTTNTKDYGNGAGSVIPTSLQPNPLPVDPDLEESDTPDVPSPTSQYTPPPATTSVVVDPTITQEPSSTPPPPAETEAPVTTLVVDNSEGQPAG